jgi:hypothetical protein
MKTSSLRKNQPHLEAIFGALSAEDDSKIRSILKDADEVLLEIANHYGRDRAGWEGTGLELTWMESGQVAISSFVGACIARGGCVDFTIDLQPSWCYGEKASTLSWNIESGIEADCGHADDHGGMHRVHEVVARSNTPIEAAIEVLNAVRELRRLATAFPLEHWLEMSCGH